MNNLRTYDEYLNEGFYEWMNGYFDDNNPTLAWKIVLPVFIGICIQLGHVTASGVGHTIILLIGALLQLPAVTVSLRYLFRNQYNSIRSKVLLKETNTEYKKVVKMVEKYPDIEEKVSEVKLKMIEAINNKDKTVISECIHEVYEISKNIKKREELGDFFNLTEEEKKKIKDKKNKIKKLDPYGEEHWETDNEEKNWWEKK